MVEAERSVVIARPPAEVYDFLLDGSNSPSWCSAVIGAELVSAADATPTYRLSLHGPGGSTISSTYEVRHAERPYLLEIVTIAGSIRPVLRFELSDASEGRTALRCVASVTTRGVWRFAEGAVRRQLEAQVAQLEDLRHLLEAPA